MKRVLGVELEIATDVSPLELASKIELAVRETLEAMRQSFGAELEFELFLTAVWPVWQV